MRVYLILIASFTIGGFALANPEYEFDFNSLNAGNLREQTDDSPNSIGSWSLGSSVADVVSNDLSAPLGTNYSFTSTVTTPRSVNITRSDNAFRAQFHEVSPINAGVIWASILLQADSQSAAAATLDGATADGIFTLETRPGFGIRPDSTAGSTELFWSDDLGDLTANQSATLSDDFSGQTVLLVVRIDLDLDSDNVAIWINPSLSDIPSLGVPNLTATTTHSSVDHIGVGAVNTGIDGYNVSFDNFLISTDPREEAAFANITGLPIVIPPSFGQADINANGTPDYAELLFPGLSSLPFNTDSDGDGVSNQSEAIAGTNPFDASSLLKIVNFDSDANPPTEFTIAFSSLAGKRYQAETSETLEPDSWEDLGPVITASADTSAMTYSVDSISSPDTKFFRIKVLPDIDTDNDGLEDLLEQYLGYDINNPASVRSFGSGGDLQQFTNLVAGGNPQGGFFGTSTAGVPSSENASRFLAQATWGPTTTSIASLQALGDDAYEQWIDQQIAIPANFTRTYMDYLASRRANDITLNRNSLPHFISNNSSFAFFRENLNTGWMRIMLFGDDQLRQRMAWALSQIVVIGPRCNSFALAAADWYDTVIEHSLGNYRDLLYDIAVHPWMGFWLSHIGNERAVQVGTAPGGEPILQMPDENFAREIMQLFSIGLWELNLDGTQRLDADGEPIPTYTNEDITQVARVFTGLNAQPGVRGRAIYSTAPMNMVESFHDDGNDFLASVYQREVNGVLEPLAEAGRKRFLGHELPRFVDEPGRTGLDDVDDAVDILFNHPSCPPFICKNLIQHLVTSNPTPAYLERVSNVFVDDGTGTRGNLAAVVKAILLDPEARNLSFALDTSSGRLKGPMLRTVHMARATDAGASTPALADDTGIQFWSPAKERVFSDYLEYPFEAPSVFNFYEPGFSRPGEIRDNNLLSPEFQIMNTLTTTTIPNRLLSFIENGMHIDTSFPGVTPNFELQTGPLEALSSTGAEELVDHLNLIFAHGFVSSGARTELIERINFHANTAANADERAELALFLSIISAEGSVLK